MQNRSCLLLLSGDPGGWMTQMWGNPAHLYRVSPTRPITSLFLPCPPSLFPRPVFGRREGRKPQESRWEDWRTCPGSGWERWLWSPGDSPGDSSVPALQGPCGNHMPAPGQRLQNAVDELLVMQAGWAKESKIRNSHACQRPERFDWKRRQLM